MVIGVERQIVTIKINHLVHSVSLITNRTYRQIKVDEASEKVIYFNEEILMAELTTTLQNNFNEDVIIENIEIYNANEIPIRIDQHRLERPGILVTIKFPINPIFYKSTIMEKIGGDKFYITLNCIKEIPIQ
jgi:hypothetical protein